MRRGGRDRSDPWHLPWSSGLGEHPCKPEVETRWPATETSCFPAGPWGRQTSAERSVRAPPRAVKPSSPVPARRLPKLRLPVLAGQAWLRSSAPRSEPFGWRPHPNRQVGVRLGLPALALILIMGSGFEAIGPIRAENVLCRTWAIIRKGLPSYGCELAASQRR
jgi:hypothetical protein